MFLKLTLTCLILGILQHDLRLEDRSDGEKVFGIIAYLGWIIAVFIWA
jgi:hypothetical protein